MASCHGSHLAVFSVSGFVPIQTFSKALFPPLPHQTAREVYPHTAFLFSSQRVILPIRPEQLLCGNIIICGSYPNNMIVIPPEFT